MSYNITIESGQSVRLPTAGKYCDRDIIVTAEGGKEDLDEVLTEQDNLIDELREVLRGKAVGSANPDGTTAWACGSFVLDEDVSSTIYIPHEMGCTPNFYVLFTEDEVAQVADYKGYIHNIVYIVDPVQQNATVRYGSLHTTYGGSSIFSNSSASISKHECTDTDLWINAASNRKLKAGIKYKWVCGVITGM